VAFELGRALFLADAIAPDALAHALFMVAQKGVSLPHALLAMGAIEPERLEEQLARVEMPVLRHVVPLPDLVSRLPPGLCETLLAVPLRRDPRTGTVDVAVVDARDAHAADEIGYWLGAPIRALRASLAAMDAALAKMKLAAEHGPRPPQPGAISVPAAQPILPNVREVAHTPTYGVRAFNMQAHASSRNDANSSPADDEFADRTEVMDFPIANRNIPIPLTTRSRREDAASPPPVSVQPTVPVTERTPHTGPHFAEGELPTLGETLPDPEEEREPVLDLRNIKPKSGSLREEIAPITSRGPYSPTAPVAPFPDVAPYIDAILAAAGRDAIIDALVTGVRTIARRVGVFVVKRDAFDGWACTPELGDKTLFKSLRVIPDAETVLSRAAGAAGARLDRIEPSEAHARLIAFVKRTSRDVATVPVRIEDRAALVVVADELGDLMIGTKRMEELARAAGEALYALIRAKRGG
jgi:hypothetical protein